ncbi:unnamed protein product [Acanthoscelides obtectus]|uniref:C2H2-type domain-containing protein n=1 Tax=Acanthoscelides obtectus TaxID=200917 RepID=A0A9P0JZC6_ACAOB|nr:unnamed protein product [Acanthoscelides obtectus]CAK1669721.1 Longitudinals lacking protein, isoforms F/I/K/T [Acanthoscelides obtectus]
MRRHERVECGGKEPTHPCLLCPYKAKQKGNLKVHMRKHHNSEYPCRKYVRKEPKEEELLDLSVTGCKKAEPKRRKKVRAEDFLRQDPNWCRSLESKRKRQKKLKRKLQDDEMLINID